jgi:hypothetical protein
MKTFNVIGAIVAVTVIALSGIAVATATDVMTATVGEEAFTIPSTLQEQG